MKRHRPKKKKKIPTFEVLSIFCSSSLSEQTFKIVLFDSKPRCIEGRVKRAVHHIQNLAVWRNNHNFSPQDCWAAWSRYGGRLWCLPWTRAGSHPGSIGRKGQHRASSLWCTPPEIYTQRTNRGCDMGVTPAGSLIFATESVKIAKEIQGRAFSSGSTFTPWTIN